MQQPLITVSIPTFNCGPYIGRAITSVLNQTYQNFEIHIFDNASTDNTHEVISSFNDSRIVYHKNNSNIGMVANWNLALTAGSGEFVKVLCADDELLHNCLQLQLEAMADKPDVAMASCKRSVVRDDGSAIIQSIGWFSKTPVSQEKLIRKCLMIGTNPVGEPGATLIRRSAIGDLRFQPGNWTLDIDLWIRILKNGSLATINRPLVLFRIRPGSVTSTTQDQSQSQVRHFLKSLRINFPSVKATPPWIWTVAMIKARAWGRLIICRPG